MQARDLFCSKPQISCFNDLLRTFRHAIISLLHSSRGIPCEYKKLQSKPLRSHTCASLALLLLFSFTSTAAAKELKFPQNLLRTLEISSQPCRKILLYSQDTHPYTRIQCTTCLCTRYMYITEPFGISHTLFNRHKANAIALF